jgi:hypothetical protein
MMSSGLQSLTSLTVCTHWSPPGLDTRGETGTEVELFRQISCSKRQMLCTCSSIIPKIGLSYSFRILIEWVISVVHCCHTFSEMTIVLRGLFYFILFYSWRWTQHSPQSCLTRYVQVFPLLGRPVRDISSSDHCVQRQLRSMYIQIRPFIRKLGITIDKIHK